MQNYFVEYLNAALEADFFPEVFTPVKVEDYFLRSYNRKLEGTVLDKLLTSDMDGVWNSKDSRTFAEYWVEFLCIKYGFTDAQQKDILKNLAVAQKTFDKERVKKAIKPFIEAGFTYEVHLDACYYGAHQPSMVPGAIQFRDEMLRSGYAIVLNSLSPIEMVEIVGYKRLGIPRTNCFGTRLFDENRKLLPEPEFNFSPVKRIRADAYKSQHGLTEKSLEAALSDDISDVHMRSRVSLHPSVWLTDSNELPDGVRFKFPEGREYIFPLVRKFQQYEVGLMQIALGKNLKRLCRLRLDITNLFENFRTQPYFENDLKEFIMTFVQEKSPAMQKGCVDRITRLLNRTHYRSHTAKIKILEKILFEELKTYTFEFSFSEERLRALC